MSKTRVLALIAAAGGVLALTACATPEPPEGGVRIDQQNNLRPALDSVRVIDGTLARYVGRRYEVRSVLDVEGVYLSRTETGFPKVTAQIRNKTDVAIPLEVRASWFDAGGVPVDSAASWTHLFVQPQAMVTFEQISAKSSSAHYYVEIRGAQ